MGGKTDGRHPKFRLLCKICNSYSFTMAEFRAVEGPMVMVKLTCDKCHNNADSFDEELSRD